LKKGEQIVISPEPATVLKEYSAIISPTEDTGDYPGFFVSNFDINGPSLP
jgi:hypothetical protein